MQQAESEVDVEISWKPFQLRPDMPEGGKPKPGGPGIHQVNARLREVGAKAGIEFTGMCDRFPHTMQAHELMCWALETSGPEVQNNLQEVLFRHYFTDGRYPDVDNLSDAAKEVGLDEAEAREILGSGQYRAGVLEEMRQASSKGITGVPFFFVDGKSLGSGAQPSEFFLRALRGE